MEDAGIVYIHGVVRKTTHISGSVFFGPRNWSLHMQLRASLLCTQGGLKGDALLSASSQGWGTHADLAFPSARSHAEELGVTVGARD